MCISWTQHPFYDLRHRKLVRSTNKNPPPSIDGFACSRSFVLPSTSFQCGHPATNVVYKLKPLCPLVIYASRQVTNLQSSLPLTKSDPAAIVLISIRVSFPITIYEQRTHKTMTNKVLLLWWFHRTIESAPKHPSIDSGPEMYLRPARTKHDSD